MKLSKRDKTLLIFAIETAIRSEEEFIEAHRVGSTRGKKYLPDAIPAEYKATTDKSKRWIKRGWKMMKRLRAELEGARRGLRGGD